ncbi:transglutaminase family protein [Paludisphaera mucosa]|uniref:Transglutaminase family protein n=1 Tax=Paludisphaera mucosa TaxID=3030827 RepID=A0ABT6FBT6_9BACT|nr:transglutaminase family protein [Paludisphaera mucosa]MDG3004997.1 transglutaminase family protein [Paludisphaera mucosa]
MKRIRIVHSTAYHYHEPVRFGAHRALLRPREGHDVHIAGSKLSVEPRADVRWIRDVYGNSIAFLTFAEPGATLRLESEVDVDLYADGPIDCAVDPSAQWYPFQYDAAEQVEIVPYRLPSYPHDGAAVQAWLRELYSPGRTILTADLLNGLNGLVYRSFRYKRREEAGVQVPCETLRLGTGSCRDYAVFLMEASRHLGFAARFVTGYVQMGEGQHGATHAWTEIYIPGAGWRGFDPTNDKLAGSEHVSVAVSRDHEKASPLSGSWSGPAGAFDRMEVSVQVFGL